MTNRSTIDRVTQWFIDRAMFARNYAGRYDSSKTHTGIGLATIGSGDDSVSKQPPPFNSTDDEQQRISMTIGWIYSNINMLGRDVSAAPIGVILKSSGEEVKNHPALDLIQSPSEHLTTSYILQFTVAWLVLDGNAYWYLAPPRNDRSKVIEIWPISSNRIRAIPDEKEFIKKYAYKLNDGSWVPVPVENIVHFMLPNPWNQTNGLSMLTALGLPGDTDRSTAKFQRDFYKKGRGIPQAVVSLNEEVSDLDFDIAENKLREDFQEERRIAVVRAGDFDVKTVGISPQDLQIIASRQFTSEEIDKIFWGIPIGRVSQDGTAAREARKQMLENGVRPLHQLLSEQMTLQIMKRFFDELHKFEFEDVRKQDRAQRVQEFTIYSRVMSINEARKELKMEKYENKDFPGVGDLLVPWAIDPSFLTLYYGLGIEFENFNVPGQGDQLRHLSNAAQNARDKLAQQRTSMQTVQGNPPSMAGQDSPVRDTGQKSVVQDEPKGWRETVIARDIGLKTAIRDDLKRWKKVATKEMERGEDPSEYHFDSKFIPVFMADDIRLNLKGVLTKESINEVFETFGYSRLKEDVQD